MLQANLVKQLAKLLKVRYVEDITASKRVGECAAFAPSGSPIRRQPSVVNVPVRSVLQVPCAAIACWRIMKNDAGICVLVCML